MRKSYRVSVWKTLAAGVAVLTVWAEPGRAEHSAAPAAKREESVLIATRELPDSTSPVKSSTSTVADDDSLEPISQCPDRTPELATPATEGVQHEQATAGSANTSSNPSSESAAQNAGSPNDATQSLSTDLPDSAKRDAKIQSGAAGTSSRGIPRISAASPQSVPFEPVKFQGISVGKTSKHELITAWGEPADTLETNDGMVLLYRKAPFKAVEALLDAGEVVSTIKVTLATPLGSKELAEQLSLDHIDPVTVSDDTDQPLGQAFPERGVLFMFAASGNITPIKDAAKTEDTVPATDEGATESSEKTANAKSPLVSHVVIQPLDGNAFALRAENRLHGPYTQNITDLKTAIDLDPQFARAYWLLARIYLATGQTDQADAAASDACNIEPKSATYQLCRAQAREHLGHYDESVIIVRGVLDRDDIEQLDRAQALHQMGRLASLGDAEIASKAISFEQRAIETADKLANSKDYRERRAAKQLLVEAHVGVAEEIARQPYNQKVESLSLWIGRASGLAEDFINKDGGSIELRLYISQRALASLASFKPTLDPSPWVTEAEESAKALLAQSDDELWQQHIKWELGIAHLNALRVEHTRRQTDAALNYGQQAVNSLAAGASNRQAVPSSEQLVGQLYFQMGAVYAVHKLDHAKAAQWYEKAEPLLTSTRPASELYCPRREGEMLVSMGVTYWQLGDQTHALELTQSGVSLVEAAVDNGVLAKSTLAVPYGNLATMYQQMGETANAAKYSALAKSAGSSETKQTTQTVKTATGSGHSPMKHSRAR
jgi:tetratricopeptide (TPR) repeat protein